MHISYCIKFKQNQLRYPSAEHSTFQMSCLTQLGPGTVSSTYHHDRHAGTLKTDSLLTLPLSLTCLLFNYGSYNIKSCSSRMNYSNIVQHRRTFCDHRTFILTFLFFYSSDVLFQKSVFS